MKKEYISRDALIEEIKAQTIRRLPKFSAGLTVATEIASNIKAADVAEVIRCVKCKYYTKMYAIPSGGLCAKGLVCVGEDDFCSRAKPYQM